MKTRNCRKTLLVLDDDRSFCQTVKDGLVSGTLEVMDAHTLAEGMAICRQKRIDVVLLDQNLPDGKGQDLCPQILDHNEHAKIIFVTAYPSFDHAVEAVRAGAHDYLSKPFELGELKLAVGNSLRTLELERVEQLEAYRIRKDREETVLIGDAGGLADIQELVFLAASTNAPVLITGETGVGKNVVARSIHYRTFDTHAPFVSINCASLPEHLMESELFGHEKGAFTGAMTARKGLFEVAEGGTLFLDEIAEMPPGLQAKLLGVLEDRTIRRIGGDSFRPVQVRIIAATNSDLERPGGNPGLREDLYYRLSVIRIHIPPLRERRDDIPKLCRFFLGKMAQGHKVWLPSRELVRLRNYRWPGNVRELRNILERSVLLQREGPIKPSQFVLGNSGEDSLGSNGRILTMEEVQKQHILQAIDRFAGNYTQTAKALRISISTLKRKIRSLNHADTCSE